MAIIKVPGNSKLDSEEAKGNNLVDQAVKSVLKSIKTKALIGNVNYLLKKDLKLIFKDTQSRAPHKGKFYWDDNGYSFRLLIDLLYGPNKKLVLSEFIK